MIEELAPPRGIYGIYSAAKHLLKEPPADYDKVYFYIAPADLTLMQKRFTAQRGETPNVFALTMHPTLKRHGSSTSLVQTYIDVWNMRDWYARDFLQALSQRLHDLLP